MTTKDYQCLLSVLRRRDGSPYYTGQPDGIWGPLSRKALEDFQQSTGTLPVTGSPDTAPGKALRQAIAREGFPGGHLLGGHYIFYQRGIPLQMRRPLLQRLSPPGPAPAGAAL